MRYGRPRQAGELNQKLHRHTHQRRNRDQSVILAGDPRLGISQGSPRRRREADRGEQKSVEHQLTHRQIAERPFPEKKAGAPDTSGRGKGGKRASAASSRGNHLRFSIQLILTLISVMAQTSAPSTHSATLDDVATRADPANRVDPLTRANPVTSADPATLLFSDLDVELATTRRMLERVPDGKDDWRPHKKSRTLDELATHVAQLPGFGILMLTRDEYDGGTQPPEPKPSCCAERVETFDEVSGEFRRLVKEMTWDHAMSEWTLKFRGQVGVQCAAGAAAPERDAHPPRAPSRAARRVPAAARRSDPGQLRTLCR